MDMTSVWVAEHGWAYLNAIIDCCTREIPAWALDLRCRKEEALIGVEAGVAAHGVVGGTLTLGTDNGTAYTSTGFRSRLAQLERSPTAAAATATPSLATWPRPPPRNRQRVTGGAPAETVMNIAVDLLARSELAVRPSSFAGLAVLDDAARVVAFASGEWLDEALRDRQRPLAGLVELPPRCAALALVGASCAAKPLAA